VRKTKNSVIEISKKIAKAGRTPIKLILHELHKDSEDYNGNGIHWTKEYAENNIESVKGMPLVAQFMDSENKIPFGSHGDMIVEENRVIFEDSLVVGSFESGYIAENIEVNSKIIDAVVGVGYVYDQRFPELVDYLQEEYDNGNSVEGSIEICADKSLGNKKIIYDGGWKEKCRKPQLYQYSGHALVIGEVPADRSALMLELNTLKKKEVIILPDNINNKDKTIIEINSMNYNDISMIVESKFNKKQNTDESNYSYYYVHKFYPTISTFIMKSWDKTGEYIQVTYTVENGEVKLGDIINKVEEDWKPINGEESVEVNTPVKNILNSQKNNQTKEESEKMDEKIVLELNQKIEDKINEINSLNKSLEQKGVEVNSLTKSLEEKQAEINTLTEKATKLDANVAELNTTIVEVNKLLESEKTEKCAMEDEKTKMADEMKMMQEEKDKDEMEKKKVEVNSYFETEITKNGFEESEVNSLKSFVESVDLEGLKKAEAELCAKKFKEMIANNDASDVEVNSTNAMFISIKEKEMKKVPGSIPSFFN